jgi:hypothetical protein
VFVIYAISFSANVVTLNENSLEDMDCVIMSNPKPERQEQLSPTLKL